jgi:hypothetical protein
MIAVLEENHAVATSSLGRVDYADRYSIALAEPMDAPRFCSMILESAPRWVDLLLSARDKVAAPLGFSTQERNYGQPVRLGAGAKFGPLTVHTIAPDLVVCGNGDKHLAFRAYFEVDAERQWGAFTTEVQFIDALGRAYFTLVRPFHKRVIPALVSAPFPARARAERPGPRR